MALTYDVLVSSLHPDYYKRPAGSQNHNTAWVRNIEAPDLVSACRYAEAQHPNLGCTTTITSMCWPNHPKVPSWKT